MAGTLLSIVLAALVVAAGVLLLIFVAVPLLKGLGWMIGGFFRGLGWLIAHLFEFVTGMIGDSLRFVGSIIATIVLMPLVVLNVVIGRWSAAGHFTDSVKREWKVGFLCLYRVLLRRPLKLCLLHGLLEGVEERVPEAMAAAPTRDKPSKRTGKFQGYTIVGSLRGGGSGAKLYIAQPDESVIARYPGMPDRVVIKSFALAEGSSLPQIVRESRALECAKQLGLVFEHGMDEQRFYYVMPYHAGDHLGIVVRQLHAESGERGLGRRQLNEAMSYTSDLVRTLSVYHQGGLWHKDVKPENVIVHDGLAHLVDLGLVTPLRSAMTLTTHGTEYFRDPEMVRMALRGVKVHQVNGAKFDIFAIGAVLYFVIENDFPAHGALSRFTKQSPDALKWIVRRAMADYSHRYETADAMLADMHHLAAASDPFAVKPASLPSMLGQGDQLADLVDEEPEVQQYADMATPPEAMPPAGAAVASVTPAAYTPRPAAVPTPMPPPGSKRRRPRIEVTNWWTGQYRVQDTGTPGTPGTPGAAPENPMRQHVEFARQQAARLRHEAAALRRKVETGRLSPHRAARDQVRAARARAKEIRQRTHVRRSPHSRGPGERHPSMAMLFVTLLVVLPLVGVAMIIATLNRRSAPRPIITMDTGRQAFVIPGEGIPFALQMSNEDGPPLLLVPQLDDEQMIESEDDLAEIILRNESLGYNVLISEALLATELPALVKSWQDDPADEVVDEALENLLEIHDLYGLLVVMASGDDENTTLHNSVIKSTRPGANERRASTVMLPPAPQPFILVNDHPTSSTNTAVESVINYRIEQLRARGWEIIDDNLDLEAAILKAGLDDPSSPRLQAVLQDAQLGGIVHVYAPTGEEPADERIAVTVILTDDEPVSIEVPAGLPTELPAELPDELPIEEPMPF